MPMYMLMADRPMATAPDRSMAAFSTMQTRRPRPRAQLAASKAAPQPAMPPPTMRTSHSTVSTAGSNGIGVLRAQALMVGSLSMWRYLGSPMSSWLRKPSWGGSGSPSVASIEPQAVVRIGYLNRLTSPFRYWIAHMIESVPRSGVTRDPIGITSA